MNRPHCYNRPDFLPGYWGRNGMRAGRPVYRWVPFRMSHGCKSWSVPPGTTPAPVLDGWQCDGCRHDPRAIAASYDPNKRCGMCLKPMSADDQHHYGVTCARCNAAANS